MQWKVQEYEKVLDSDIYLRDMHGFIERDKDWKVIDYTERQHAIEDV